MKTKIELRKEMRRKEFWAIIKTRKPKFYRALELAGDIDSRLLAICASALVSIAMKQPQKSRKISQWQIFMGEHLGGGKTMQEVAKLWKEKTKLE